MKKIIIISSIVVCVIIAILIIVNALAPTKSKITPEISVEKTGDNKLLTNDSTNVIDKEGNVYSTVTIEDQTWIAQNLKTTKFNDGTDIPMVTDDKTWESISSPAYCWYNNDSSNKADYGALYNWFAVSTAKLCPTGWHISTFIEWETLENWLGVSVAGGELKGTGLTHWLTTQKEVTNKTGFTALPGGSRSRNGEFRNIGSNGIWWSTHAVLSPMACLRLIGRDSPNIDSFATEELGGYSVRCVKN